MTYYNYKQSGAVPRYKSTGTVIGTVDTFYKMYRFWYRCYFLDDFTRHFGNFILINLREQKRKNFRYFPRKASSKSIAKPRCCRSVVGNHRAAAPCRISRKVDLPDIRQICYPAHPELQITKLKKKIIKKFPNARAGQTSGHFQIFFLLFTDFQWKNSRSADVQTFFYFCSSMLCGGNLDPHFLKSGDCVG